MLEYGAIPYEITHPGKSCAEALGQVVCEGQPGVTGTAPDQAPWWVTPVTSMFMHASLIHLAGNMLFLWIFGNNIEDSMGGARFVAFYLLGGLAAIGAQTLVDPNAAVPTVGASGAIAAVLGGYALLYPPGAGDHSRLHHHLLHDRRVPALVVLGFWILVQVWLGASQFGLPRRPAGSGGVAYFAHIGGFPVRPAGHQTCSPIACTRTTRRSHIACRSIDGQGPPFWPGRWRSIALLIGLTIAAAVEGGIIRFGGGRNACRCSRCWHRRVRVCGLRPPDE